MIEVSVNRGPDTPNWAARIREALADKGFTITGLPDDLTRDQAVDVLGRLHTELEAAQSRHTPMSDQERRVLETMAEASGITLADLADECGVDLDQASQSDVRTMSLHLGGVVLPTIA